jgi:spore coat protein U-like protein
MRAALSGLAVLAFSCALVRGADASCSSVVEMGTIAYDPQADEPTRVPAAIDVRCSGPSQPKSVQIAIGSGATGRASLRALMADGPRALLYAIVLPDGRPWGDGSDGTSVQTVTLERGRARIPFLAVVEPHQRLPEGAYSDALTVSLSY